MGGGNRKAYILTATGDFAVVSGRWRRYCAEAFLTRDEAEAAEPGFLERCRAAESEILGPDPETLSVRIVAVEFEDDLDADDGEIFMLSAEGREATFDTGARIPFLCGTVFASRERAEAEMPAFLDRCADPALGDRHSLRSDLAGRIGALALRRRPEDTPDLSPGGP